MRPYNFSPRTLLGLALCLPLLAACGSSSSTGGSKDAATGVTMLHHNGRLYTDEQNRTVILHGVNAVWKLKPYAPPDDATGFTEADADFLSASGFNVVRLGVLFAGVMPTKGVIDTAYLDQVDRVVQMLAARHIWVLLDFHQDMLNEKYQGEGFPDWAVDDSGLPNDATHGFPLNEFVSITLNTAFDNFWNNKNDVWSSYIQAWQATATRWKGQPYILGYDVFNEPWPGLQWPTCFELDCFLFDAKLKGYFQQMITGIRAVDTEHLIFIEPQQLFDFGSPSHITGLTDPALGLSWHAYCSTTLTAGTGLPALPDCTVINVESRSMNNADTQADLINAASLLTEFGATDDLSDHERVLTLADQHLVSWTYWAYKGWSDPTGGPTTQGMFTDDTDFSTLKPGKADLLIRPYAQAIAGVPTAMSFDNTSKKFALSYNANSSSTLTEIFVPARHYPGGYTATVTGGHVVSGAGTEHLQIVADEGTGLVSVAIQP